MHSMLKTSRFVIVPKTLLSTWINIVNDSKNTLCLSGTPFIKNQYDICDDFKCTFDILRKGDTIVSKYINSNKSYQKVKHILNEYFEPNIYFLQEKVKLTIILLDIDTILILNKTKKINYLEMCKQYTIEMNLIDFCNRLMIIHNYIKN